MHYLCIRNQSRVITCNRELYSSSLRDVAYTASSINKLRRVVTCVTSGVRRVFENLAIYRVSITFDVWFVDQSEFRPWGTRSRAFDSARYVLNLELVLGLGFPIESVDGSSVDVSL